MMIERKTMNIIRIPEWNDSLLTGEEIIDEQHKGIFRLAEEAIVICSSCSINDWSSVSPAEIATEDILIDSIYALGDYIVGHFYEEELLMEESEYPGYEEHKEAHMILSEKVVGYMSKMMSGGEISPDKFSIFILEWLQQHILHKDKEFITFYKDNS